MFPTALPSPADHSAYITTALWDLDPALLPLLRTIVGDTAEVGLGARLVMAACAGEPRVLVSVHGNHYPWKALASSVLEHGEVMAGAGSVGAPVCGPSGSRGVLVLHHEPDVVPPHTKELVRAHAARLETALSLAATHLASRQGAVNALVQTLHAHDAATARHTIVIHRLIRPLGEAAGLAPHAVLELEWIALLHDIGKIGVPQEVLRKNGPLSPSEWAVMRQHPAIGERIVRAMPGLDAVALALRHHHERWDGAGYPDRLAGEAIPLSARLVALVDAYETMCTGRPYRAPLSRQEALRELRRAAGYQFDPALLPFLPVLMRQDIGV